MKELSQKYLETLKYSQKLENELLLQSKEVQKLHLFTKFNIINQKKHEEMISHLFEENRKLKEKLDSFTKITLSPQFLKKSQDSSQKPSIHKEKSEIHDIPTMRKSLKKVQNTTYRLCEESVSHQHILNMNLSVKAEKLLYEDNEFVSSLSPILIEQDIFIDYVSNNDMSSLITLYDNLNGLFTEHKSLYFLIYRLKKIIKAANVMTSSLILAESIEKIVDETIEFLLCDRATVFILDEKKEELWSKVAKGSDFTIKMPMDRGIVGHVVMTGKSVNIVDAYSDERFNKQVDIRSNYKTKTILCCPILDVSNRVTGAIQAINKINGSFTKDDEGLLAILANIAGSILKNSLHYDEQLLFQNNLRHIIKNGIMLNAIFSYEKLIPYAEKVLKNMMNVEQSRIFLLNQTENLLVRFTENEEFFYDSNSGIAGFVVKTKEFESISNAYSHPLFNGKIDIETTLPIICMPILQPETNEIIGVFEVLNPKGLQGSGIKQKSKIIGVEYEILQFFRLQLAQIIANMKEMEKVKGTDMLSREAYEMRKISSNK